MSSDMRNDVAVVDDKRKLLSSMSPITIGVVVFACVFGGALLGIFLHFLLPSRYLGSDSKETVQLGMALVATTVAVALGLLVASAKDFYDTQNCEVIQLAADVALLDKLLKYFGPESNEIRDHLRSSVAQMVNATWGRSSSDKTRFTLAAESETFIVRIQGLSSQSDSQRFLQSQASSMAIKLAQTRSLMLAQKASSVPMPLVAVLVFWLTLLFTSFGLFVHPNPMVLASLFASALAVCCAIFLILEMYQPYRGLVQVSSAPLRAALAQPEQRG